MEGRSGDMPHSANDACFSKVTPHGSTVEGTRNEEGSPLRRMVVSTVLTIVQWEKCHLRSTIREGVRGNISGRRCLVDLPTSQIWIGIESTNGVGDDPK